ncbi:MAG: uroporphyrinogen decarboxylase family protein [Clostridiales bacterium]|jgi:uroporphyrinogen-III decarboxylase|nr:uroporphyrinogen-III decarboxylase [Eubacteriales bacterium]MDH7567917.1 uroporphyrinogen decarboxylase family protein [Clostridiales bacterium]
MKTTQELHSEHVERIRKAIALEKTDRTPCVIMADAFCANHMGAKMSEFCMSAKYSNEIMLRSAKELGLFDGMSGTYVYAPMFSMGFLSKVKVAGKELPEGSLWQIDEQGLMTTEDYDTILEKGWSAFRDDFYVNRLNIDLDELHRQLEYEPIANQNFIDAGYAIYYGVFGGNSIDYLSGGRSISKFMMDLRRMPDKVEAVLDVIVAEEIESLKFQFSFCETPPLTGWLSTARGSSDYYSPKMWERFVWKTLKKLIDTINENGSAANVHMDGMWERDLDYFREVPKGELVCELDSTTNIYKVKEKLGDIACVKGDVPPAMLALASVDEVYNYSTKLIKELGNGFILSSGCSVPPNAKVENVKAMIAAASGK